MKIKRIAEAQVEKLLKQFPAVGLVGPRQCGKTTVALTIQKQLKAKADYFDLESPADLRKFYDIEFFLTQHQDANLIIDDSRSNQMGMGFENNYTSTTYNKDNYNNKRW